MKNFFYCKIPFIDASRILDDDDDDRSRTRNSGIKLRKRSARRKQVRKISFPLNDEEGRGSQRMLFPICGCPVAAPHPVIKVPPAS